VSIEELSRAWATGIEAVEPLLAESVVFELGSGELPGCRGRGEVVALLRGLVDPVTGRLPPLIFEELPDGAVLAQHDNAAVVLHLEGHTVSRMVQYSSREDALDRLSGVGEDPTVAAAVEAIHGGDIDALRGLLVEHPELATVRLGTSGRTLLHVVTDWPGHYPRGAETVAVLVAAGADVNARFTAGHTETPLHWAASSDDVAVLDALLDAGADIEADGAVIGGGTPLADATAFGQWNAARRLIERGARANLGEAASLGLLDRVGDHLAGGNPTAQDVTSALWMACHGGQQAAASMLIDAGADVNWVGYDDLTPLDAAVRSGAADLAEWLRRRRDPTG